MRYMLVATDKSGSTVFMELSRDAYLVPIDNNDAAVAVNSLDTEFFANAADIPGQSVIPVIESVEFEDEKPVVTLDRDTIKHLLKCLKRIEDPDDTMLDVELDFGTATVKVKS